MHAAEGHSTGAHAPGRRNQREMLLAGHTTLLAHGYAVRRFRQAGFDGGIGPIINHGPVYPVTESEADCAAARRFDAFLNRWFLDPVFLGDYPAEMRDAFGPDLPEITDEEREIIRWPIDHLGINYYSRVLVAHDPEDRPLGIKGVSPENARYTALGWEIYPPGLHEALMAVKERYGDVPMYVTENGAAFEDRVGENGEVDDPERIEFLRDHLVQVHKAIDDGAVVRGFFAYTLMDNFECALGFTPEFGLVRTDFATQERTVKASGRWYGEVSRSGRLTPAPPPR